MKIKLNFKRKFINEDTDKVLTQIKIGNRRINVEIASNEGARTKGLQSREELSDNSGMLFIFEEPKILSFWMKNTYIPLSIAYLDENYKIIEIFDMKPLDRKPIVSSKPAKYALEVNKGWFKRNNITSGALIDIKNNNFL